jgi:GNAT superfamily N-acetyltransferase
MPYPADPALRASTMLLLGSVWSKLPHGIERAREWGADWLDHSEPFVRADAGVSIAHVGIMEIPVVLDGRAVTLAGIHAVCTHLDHRGRGHLRETMLRALAWVDGRYEAAVLWANDPAIYGRFGFVPRAESVFRAARAGMSAERRTRTMSLESEGDVRLLCDSLSKRAPVSTRCGARDPGWLSLINLGLWGAPAPTIAFAEDLDAIVVYEIRERALRLYDVIAESIPTLESIERFLGPGFDSVEVFFSPDALDAPALEATPTPLVDCLMVRGPVLSGRAPLAISPLSRC